MLEQNVEGSSGGETGKYRDKKEQNVRNSTVKWSRSDVPAH